MVTLMVGVAIVLGVGLVVWALVRLEAGLDSQAERGVHEAGTHSAAGGRERPDADGTE